MHVESQLKISYISTHLQQFYIMFSVVFVTIWINHILTCVKIELFAGIGYLREEERLGFCFDRHPWSDRSFYLECQRNNYI